MRRKRTRVLAGILAGTIALTGILVGTVAADDEAPRSRHDTVMVRVAEILGIDQTDVENAFQQATEEQREARRQEMERARESRIQGLIDEGAITEEQVEEWEAWLASRPDNRDEIRKWFESRPDLDGMPAFGMARGGHGETGRQSGLMAPGWSAGECPQGYCPPFTSPDVS